MKGQDEKERNNYSLSGPIVVATFMMFAFVEAPNKKKCHCLLCAALCPLYVIRVQHFLLSELSQYFKIYFFQRMSLSSFKNFPLRIQQFSIEIPSLLHLRVKYLLKKLWNLNTKFVLKVLSIYLSLCLRPLHQVAPIWVGAFEQRNFQIFSAKFTKYANGIPFFAGRCCVWLVSFPILFRSNKKLLWRKPSAEIWQQRKSIYAIAAFYDAAAKIGKI